MIKKVKGGYTVTSHSGKKLRRLPTTRAKALAQLRAIEASKARRGK